jgi:hypothetical protein
MNFFDFEIVFIDNIELIKFSENFNDKNQKIILKKTNKKPKLKKKKNHINLNHYLKVYRCKI